MPPKRSRTTSHPKPKQGCTIESIKNVIRCASQSLSSGLSEEKLMALYGNRKAEIEILEDFVRNCHELDRAEFFFVSGTPGSGKTFSINQIMLKMSQENIAMPVYLNCFELDSQSSIHEVILEATFQAFHKSVRTFVEKEMQRTGEMGSHATFLRRNAQTLLERCCLNGWKEVRNAKNKRIILLVLDEIDSLIRRGSQPFSEIFSVLDLLRHAECGICVIGISNQVGLSAFEENKLVSRIKGQLIFKAYTEEELFELIIRRMEVFGGQLQMYQKSTQTYAKVRIFQYHAMCIVARKCGGLEGDARKVIHGFNHVLTHFLEQNANNWKSILEKVEYTAANSTNTQDGIIDPQFAFHCMESFAPSFIEPQLKGLPYLAYVVLAICCRIVNIRAMCPKTPTGDFSSDSITTDVLFEALHTIIAQLKNLPGADTQSSQDAIHRLQNYAGVHNVLSILSELHIIRFAPYNGYPTRAAFQLTIDIKVLRRALRDEKYCPYSLTAFL